MGVASKQATTRLRSLNKVGKQSAGVLRDITDTARHSFHSMRDLATIFGVVAGVSFAPIIAASKAFGDFQKNMLIFQSVSKATRGEMEAFKQTAFSIGESTIYSAKQIAEVGVQLSRFGFTVKQVNDILPSAVNAAIANNVKLADSTQIVSSTLRAFQLEGAKASHVSDVLTKASLNSGASFTDLGQSLKYAAPVAKLASQSLEEVANALALMGNAGIKQSIAGTAMRTILTRLTKTSNEARSVMLALGITVSDIATGKMLPLHKIVEQLKTKLSGLTDETKNYAIATIFGKQALSGISALINTTTEDADKMLKKMHDVKGITQETSEAMQQGLNFAFSEMISALETMATTLGEDFAPALIGVMHAVQGFFQGIRALPAETR